MYAIAIDIDAASMDSLLEDPSAGFDEISALLDSEGFEDQGGSVFFGTEGTGPVEAVLAARRLGSDLPWLRTCLRGIRVLRVAEISDLKPAFEAGSA